MLRRRLIRGAAMVLVLLAIVGLDSTGWAEEPKDCRECHEGKHFARLDDEFDHEPFAKQECYSCHIFHDYEPRAAFHSPLVDVCLGCHADVVAVPSNLIHGPMHLEESCALCHAPHSAPHDKLLLSPLAETCLNCHDGVDDASLTVHAPFADGECVACHDPHGTYFDNLFHLPAGYTCQGCHEGVVPAAGPEVMHTADDVVSCENCHSGHQSAYPSLLLEPAADLCAGCHDVEPSAAGWHGAVAEFGCGDCHDPHFDVNAPDVPEADAEYCSGCHGEIEEKAALEVPHAVVEDCTTCHDVHGRLVLAEVADLCGDCHDSDDHPALDVPVSGACTSCHDPHGTDSPSLLLDTLHAPYEEGDCESCHDPDDPDLLQQNELCLACHDEPEAEGPHALADTRCVDCHSPHSAGREFLLRGISVPAP